MPELSLNSGNKLMQINPDTATLSIDLDTIKLEGFWSATCHTLNGRSRIVQGSVGNVAQESLTSPFGTGIQVSVKSVPSSGLMVNLQAALYDEQPFVMLRAGIKNQSEKPVNVDYLSPFSSTDVSFSSGPLDGWVNGFHSWSFSGYIPHTQKQPRSPLNIFIRPQTENITTRTPKKAGKYVGEWVAALINPQQQALVMGFIGVENMFGQVYMDGRPESKSIHLENNVDSVRLDPNEMLWGEWAIIYQVDLPHADPLETYAQAVTQLTPARGIDQPPTPGWSSWYQFFADVTAQDMARNLAALDSLRDELPLSLFQLDDGYQPAWGDWLSHNDKFTGGVDGWAEEVRSRGFKPGLWLAPFTVDRKSNIYQQHPEALIRNKAGQPAHGGFLLNRWIKGLDPTHPITKEFIQNTIYTIVHDWGIEYLKLDFLQCATIPGTRYDPKRTRAQGLRDGLQLIRETAGDTVTLLGCGCPLGPALGIVDIYRASADVAPYWSPELFGIKFPFQRDYNLPGARNSITMSINRSWTHRRWWWLDADNLMVREQQELTRPEIQSLTTTMGMLDSHYVLSDDLPGVSQERLRWATALLPFVDGEVSVPGLFDQTEPDLLLRKMSVAGGDWILAALFNWNDTQQIHTISFDQLGVPSGKKWLYYEFWGNHVDVIENKIAMAIPAHGVKLIALRQLIVDQPQYLGSDIHFSMGGEVVDWNYSPNKLRFILDVKRKFMGNLWLRLPQQPLNATCNNVPKTLEFNENEHIYTLEVSADQTAHIQIEF